MTRRHIERDDRICQLYREGATQEELANRFHVSTSRIGRIVCKAGLTPADRSQPVRNRSAFTGVSLAPGVKEAVRFAAHRDGKSISLWISDVVKAELLSQGVSIEFKAEESRDLPFEG